MTFAIYSYHLTHFSTVHPPTKAWPTRPKQHHPPRLHKARLTKTQTKEERPKKVKQSTNPHAAVNEAHPLGLQQARDWA